MNSRVLNVLILALTLCSIAAPPALAAGQTRVVQFAKATSSAILRGSIKGDNYVDYRLRAGAGQTMTVSMSANNASAYFNVLPPGSKDEAIFNSSVSGNQWSGQLQQAGDYTIRVYLYRNEARRGTAATYTLKVAISGASGGVDAKVPGTSFHATGQVPCTLGTAVPTTCSFGVVRGKPGEAEVRITPPGGLVRTLKFSGAQVTAPSSQSIKASKQGDEWSIEVNDFERYRVPDAVINGG